MSQSESNCPFNLTGRSALVTGGSKGIGFAIAAGFARAGADVFLCSRGQERLDQAVGELRSLAPDVKIEATIADMAKRNVYSATKAALIGMCRASALDLGPHGITVNCIAPGPIATEMPMSILSQEQQDAFSRRTAVGRWGKPEEIAGPALLLASDAGSYITGSTIVVDGGIMANVF